ncbi:MAG: sulfotransferase [Burkholderiaceae bacterium]
MSVQRPLDIDGSQIGLEDQAGLSSFKLRRHALRLSQSLVHARDRVMFAPSLTGVAGHHAISAPPGHMTDPFFILGNPRSGTTLLRETINRHSLLFIPPENGQLQAMMRAFGGMRRAPWHQVVDAVIDSFSMGYEVQYWSPDLDELKAEAKSLKPPSRSLAAIFDLVYRAYGAKEAPGKAYWGDKSTPGHFEYLGKLNHVFPQSKFVYIVRDGRDSVLSCIRAGFYSKSVVKAAYAWADNNRQCRLFGDRCGRERFLQIRYEDLVESPERELTRVFQFLGFRFESSTLQASPSAANASPDVRSLEHHQNVLKPISASSVGNWRRGLTSECVEAIMPIIKTELRVHGYEAI